mmetsp:Transcript_54654/g.153775  ORF Transcript_54654/g.153775 Transcript_54654/m.153775 type:complete len:569 (-) Transcript_54654:149-1855(-)
MNSSPTGGPCPTARSSSWASGQSAREGGAAAGAASAASVLREQPRHRRLDRGAALERLHCLAAPVAHFHQRRDVALPVEVEPVRATLRRGRGICWIVVGSAMSRVGRRRPGLPVPLLHRSSGGSRVGAAEAALLLGAAARARGVRWRPRRRCRHRLQHPRGRQHLVHHRPPHHPVRLWPWRRRRQLGLLVVGGCGAGADSPARPARRVLRQVCLAPRPVLVAAVGGPHPARGGVPERPRWRRRRLLAQPVPQPRDDLHEGGPAGLLVADALQRQGADPLDHHRRPPCAPVDEGVQALDIPVDAVELVLNVSIGVLQRGRPPRQHLEEHHAQGVHLGHLGDDARLDVQRVGVAHGARGLGHHQGLLVGLRQAGQPEVRDLPRPVLVHEYVLALHVAVEHLGPRAVKVAEPQGRVLEDAETVPPREARIPAHARVQVAAGEELVNEVALAPLPGETHQYHEVRMAEAAKHLHLFSEAALLWLGECLDGHFRAVPEASPEDGAVGPLAKAARVAEVAGGLREVLVSEFLADIVQDRVGGRRAPPLSKHLYPSLEILQFTAESTTVCGKSIY